MPDNKLNTLKGMYAMGVYEKFKDKVFLMQGIYSDDELHQLELTIDLLQNNINPDDFNQ